MVQMFGHINQQSKLVCMTRTMVETCLHSKHYIKIFTSEDHKFSVDHNQYKSIYARYVQQYVVA